jgi:hypothetical protein
LWPPPPPSFPPSLPPSPPPSPPPLPPPLPPPPAEDCAKVCLYVSSAITDSVPWLIAPKPGAFDAITDFFNSHYTNTPNQTASPNGKYADSTPASELQVGYEYTAQRAVYADSVWLVGPAYHGVQYVKTPAVNDVAHHSTLAEMEGHVFGRGNCFWMNHCDEGSKYVGDKCCPGPNGCPHFANAGNQDISGYCFRSSTGSLECGGMTSISNFMGHDQRLIDMPLSGANANSVYACPRGSAAVSSGVHAVVRLLIGGCMIGTDASHDPLAEVHVPSMCTDPADYMKGCMFPGALNYDKTARQPTKCLYEVAGCTDSTASNYNADASTDDGSCVAAVLGCTINDVAYEGVDSNTPGYQSFTFGVAYRWEGVVPYAQKPNVLNYDSKANTLSGCVVAIEGCMDSTAVNYNAYATVNSGSWCVPAVPGCMMPTIAGASSWSVPTPTNDRDGLAANFNPQATVNTGCVTKRLGCTDPTAANYDPLATVKFGCYAKKEGCLNVNALNFNCTAKTADGKPMDQPCGQLNDNGQSTNTLDGGNNPQGPPTVHNDEVCVWGPTPSPPPSPPPLPPIPPGTYHAVWQLTVAAKAANTVEDCEALLNYACEAVDNATLPVKANGNCTCVPASVQFTSVMVFGTSQEAAQALAGLRDRMGSADQMSALTGLTVITTPTFTIVVVYGGGVPGPDLPSQEEDNTGLIVGVVCGVLGGILLIGAVLYFMNKKKKSKVAA